MQIILDDHITHASGNKKTVCVTACLTSLGVPVNGFKYTGYAKTDKRRPAILRNHGFACRSRFSKLGKNPTMGKVRTAIKKMNDPKGTKYLITQHGSGYCHCVVMGQDGQTIVDTDPRKVDRRKVISIYAVWKN